MTDTLALFDVGGTTPPPRERTCTVCGMARPFGHGDRCTNCARAGHEAGRLDLDATPDVDDHQDATPISDSAALVITADEEKARRRARIVAHRERCSGVLMSPVFGVGRVSCGLCDFGPDD